MIPVEFVLSKVSRTLYSKYKSIGENPFYLWIFVYFNDIHMQHTKKFTPLNGRGRMSTRIWVIWGTTINTIKGARFTSSNISVHCMKIIFNSLFENVNSCIVNIECEYENEKMCNSFLCPKIIWPAHSTM